MAGEHVYHVRYLTEPWGKPVPADSQRESTVPNMTVSKDNYGYADEVLLVSIVRDSETGTKDYLILSSEQGGPASRDELTELYNYIRHLLFHQ